MADYKEIRAKARELMKGFCRVCPVCDGRACAGEVPGMGGLGTGESFKNNFEALKKVRLLMRVLHDATEPDTTCDVLGLKLSLPVLAAPIGGVSFNMGGKISEPEYVDSVLGGCKAAGTIGCTGDGVPPFIIDAAMDGIAKVGGHGIPFIKPWEGGEFGEKMDRALATGCPVVGVDVDAAGLITLRKMGRPVSPKSAKEWASVISAIQAKGVRFILKGIMTPDEAKLAADAGADAIVVSNHGGRVLDHSPGVAEVLPEVAAAAKGRIAVLADGGVRDGADVLKFLALGADAVLIGRPFSVSALGGLQEGVATFIEKVRAELSAAMVLTGCKSLADIGPRVIRTACGK
ncbi:FMN-dependent alpha-hydroxy acid dehydrogenase [Desulfovibrio sp. X2]|uniref:alpha-hydroxy-acid oxidizing protein n=1 Tax=Desulfovibrio sp. X2 TaxID=941449 RepID=UPI000358C47E|nr:alpha-hydroxy-acid oxidizing protein [Desulfovibrio sp. X2]EPR37365.1 FMN-dependent alpha-hydroxy acid dehydrogenase [Desulfovibrio sp. X2]